MLRRAFSSMSRSPFIGGNWKCNGTLSANRTLAGELCTKLGELAPRAGSNGLKVVVAPPTAHLSSVMSVFSERGSAVGSFVEVSAQNCNSEGNGAFTGETSPEMLVDLGVRHVILGHSERRHIYKETDDMIGKKVSKALALGLNVIPCVGETLSERESNNTFAVCERQLAAFRDSLSSATDLSRIVIAYEPVWAIGTGKTASPEQAEEVHAWIRDWLKKNVSSKVADAVRIIYGGSVNAKNAAELSRMPNVDGFLVGGASLKADDFFTIVKSKL
jgi:triosephosphate isomerase